MKLKMVGKCLISAMGKKLGESKVVEMHETGFLLLDEFPKLGNDKIATLDIRSRKTRKKIRVVDNDNLDGEVCTMFDTGNSSRV